MYGSTCHETDAPNGSKAVTLLLRLSTLALALTSAVVMATASECTISGGFGGAATATVVTFKDYPPLVYMVGSNIAAAVMAAAAIYLQLAGSGHDDEEEGPKLPRILLVVADVAVQALLYSATGAVVAAVVAYGPQISACAGAGFCEQVDRSKILSLAASFAASLAAVAKDVPLPFSVWPVSSE